MTIATTLVDVTQVRAVHDGLPPAANEVGWREALTRLAALLEAG